MLKRVEDTIRGFSLKDLEEMLGMVEKVIERVAGRAPLPVFMPVLRDRLVLAVKAGMDQAGK